MKRIDPASPDVCTTELSTRLAPITTVDAKARTATLVWSSGARVPRFDWESGRRYLEDLSLEPGHVRLDRLRGGAPLLDTHGRFSLSSVIGVVEEASIDGKEARARVRFSDREEVAPILRDVQNKIIRNVSVGYVVHAFEERGTDEKSGLPIRRAIDWEPMEISLVPIGADAGAGVRKRGEAASLKGEKMERETEESAVDLAAGETMEDALEELGPRARAFYNGLKTRKALPLDTLNGIFVRGESLKTIRGQVLDELARRSEAIPINSGHSGRGGYDEGDGMEVSLMAEALHARYGGPAPSEKARGYVGLRITDMARWALERRGIPTRGLSLNEIVTRGLHSTTDFPELLAGAGNRELRRAYDSYPGGLRRICRKSSAVDFRAKQKLQLGEAPGFGKVLAGAEFKRGKILEAKESYSLATYGVIFGITRQAFINDDLGAFMQLAARYGRAAAEFEAAQLVTLLTSNPTMNQDGTVLFHANHKNLSGTSDAISVTSLGAAKEAMRLQKGLDGATAIDVIPQFLVVPAKKETIAQQYLVQIAASQPSNANPFSGKLDLVVDPRLDAVSTVSWYLAADPAQIDTIEYSYLEGSDGVQLETRIGFDVDGMEFKARVDFGAGVLDFRGLYKNPGA